MPKEGKVVIVGVGTAGSYLGALLAKQEIQVVGYEAQKMESYRSVCAWATNTATLRTYLKEVDIGIEDYVLVKAENLIVDLRRGKYVVPTRDLATIDKPRLIMDLARQFTIRFSSKLSSSSLRSPALTQNGVSVIVDATGVGRGIIGRSREDYLLPTIQFIVEYDEPPYGNSFYVKPLPNYRGYLWLFPIGGKRFFLGAGDVLGKHVDSVREFLEARKPRTKSKPMARAIRIAPPHILDPLLTSTEPNIVAVGEAAGAVVPMLGEGIIPSIESAHLLAYSIIQCFPHSTSTLECLKSYIKKLKKTFAIFKNAYRFIRSKQQGTCKASNLHCILDAVKLAKFFLSNKGKAMTGVAPSLAHVKLAIKPF